MAESKKKELTMEQALRKLQHYCAYQERSHSEVKTKLRSLGVPRKEQDQLIAGLIEEGFLNEERFAQQFAGGRFRMKDWGRRKIEKALREKQVSDYSIRKALKNIDEKDYKKTLLQLAKKKYTSLKNEPPLLRKKKTLNYILQKGYEVEMAIEVVEKLAKAKN